MNQKPFIHFTVPFGISARPFFRVSNAAALLDRKLFRQCPGIVARYSKVNAGRGYVRMAES